MIVLIDNYDSFTYNLVQKLGEFAPKERIEVFRNDKVTVDQVEALRPTHIVISPGPGVPSDAGISEKVIEYFHKTIPILGVCLGHQGIGEVFGGKIVRAPSLMHGKTSPIIHDGKTIFSGVPQRFPATRYHSLIVTDIPPCLEVSAETNDKIVMGLRHREYPVEGIQFHPESILTVVGKQLLTNFLRR